MQDLSITILDDEAEVRTTLSQWCTRYAQEHQLAFHITVQSSGPVLVQSYRSGNADILLLDVQMPLMDGFAVAQAIRGIDSRVVIMFITNMAQYAIRGYEVSAVDYVLKPLQYTDFSIKLTKAIRALSGKYDTLLTIQSVDGVRTVAIQDVQYVEIYGHYLLFHTTQGVIKSRGSMSTQAQELRQYGFYRIHKSYCVNMRALERIESHDVICAGTRLPIGRAFKSGLMPAYMAAVGGAQ